jgi:hypothetical protein
VIRKILIAVVVYGWQLGFRALEHVTGTPAPEARR